MTIIENTITIDELKKIAENIFHDMVKAVIDIDKEILAIDAELHADLEAMLLTKGSTQKNLWGINLYPNEKDNFIEFHSMINVKPLMNNFTIKIEDKNLQQKITEIVNKKIIK